MQSHSNTTISVVTTPATLGVQADNAGVFTLQRPRYGCVRNYKDLEPLFDQACSGLNHTDMRLHTGLHRLFPVKATKVSCKNRILHARKMHLAQHSGVRSGN